MTYSPVDLAYRPTARPHTLALNEATIRRTVGPDGSEGWNLWMRVSRDPDAHPVTLAVAVNPGGDSQDRLLERVWGLRSVSPGTWEVWPPVDSPDWKHTPRLVGVPDGERWQVEP